MSVNFSVDGKLDSGRILEMSCEQQDMLPHWGLRRSPSEIEFGAF